MSVKGKIELIGTIKECLRGTQFLIEVDVEGMKKEIVGYISGRMRKNYTKVGVGDKVIVELSIYDLSNARIVKKLQKYEN